jgi:hypothetical protein
MPCKICYQPVFLISDVPSLSENSLGFFSIHNNYEKRKREAKDLRAESARFRP